MCVLPCFGAAFRRNLSADFYLRIAAQCHEHHDVVECARCQGQWPVVVFAVCEDAEKVRLAGHRALPIGHYHLHPVGHDTCCKVVARLVFVVPSPALVDMMLGKLRKLSTIWV